MAASSDSFSLPTELWRLVFDCLQADKDNRSLSVLTRTCKFFRELVLPDLYGKFETYPDSVGQDESGQSLVLFLRTVAENPDLACIVKELDIGYEDDINGGGQLREYEMELVVDICFRLGWQNPQLLSLNTSSQPAKCFRTVSELLFSLLPNLNTASLDVLHENECGQETPSSYAVESLTALKLRDWGFKGGFSMGGYGRLMQAAVNLQHLTLDSCKSIGDQPPPANLRELHIVCGGIQYHDLTKFLRGLPHLESFKYISSMEIGSQNEATPAEIVAALQPGKETLKLLEIDFERSLQMYFRYFHNHYGSRQECIRTLQDFPQLQWIKLSQDAIFRPDGPGVLTDGTLLTALFPPSLNALYLLNNHRKLFEDVFQFADAVAEGKFPNLRSVWLSGKPAPWYHKLASHASGTKHEEFSEEEEKDVAGYFALAGVEFVYGCY
ncbi:Uu.00g088230.m01.CDS01 [Anthostomella pinea]|uniref:Uu.00g088230.m01.CDS01 n=1 Tax=Anthostomella pinea TaxID=933095 RepID=A0AAI8YK35_9PEZI|nr:Uu.00g088230.m01.CDS01 [Anthostomella pinea]